MSLKKVDSVSDLGVRFDTKLAFFNHMNEKVKIAYSILGVITRHFRYMDKTLLFYW